MNLPLSHHPSDSMIPFSYPYGGYKGGDITKTFSVLPSSCKEERFRADCPDIQRELETTRDLEGADLSYSRYLKYKDSWVEWLGEIPEHWEVVPVKGVATCNDDVLDETTDKDLEIEYVEISNVDADRGIIDAIVLPFGHAPSRAHRRIQHGDILVSTVRTYLRAIASVHQPANNMIASAVIRPRSIESAFLGYLFHAEYIISEVIARSVGVSYLAINANELMRLMIPLPSLQDQFAIAIFLDQGISRIDTLISESRKFIDLLKEYRSSLITNAVTGKIDVRGYDV